jgi:hypothetical protein
VDALCILIAFSTESMTYLSMVVSYSQLKIIAAAVENTTATYKTVSQRAMEATTVPRKTISTKIRRK